MHAHVMKGETLSSGEHDKLGPETDENPSFHKGAASVLPPKGF